MTIQRISKISVLVIVIMGIMASLASASWTHLGGDPIFRGGIQGSGQAARNDFVKKSRTAKFQQAMKTAGLTKAERTAVNKAIRSGQFTSCRLKFGDVFLRMAFGTNGTSVDRNVTFADPNYKGKGAPAFCLTVKIKKGNKLTELGILVPRKCVNFGLESRKTTTVKPKEKTKKPKAPKVQAPTPAPQPAPAPAPQPQTPPATPPTPPQVPPTTPPVTPIPLVDITASPAHAYVNGKVWIFAKVKAAPGHSATLEFDALYGNVTSKKESTTYDNQTCPTGWVCYTALYWAPKDPVEKDTIAGIATQDDGQLGYGFASFEVKPDDFGR